MCALAMDIPPFVSACLSFLSKPHVACRGSVHKWLVHNFLVENVGYLSVLAHCCSFGCCTHSGAPSLLAVVHLFFVFLSIMLLAQRRGGRRVKSSNWNFMKMFSL